ncbi:hypothetical protein PoB_001768600 [Plakobranchus ocellatus]|uniref:Uncharacterized protein n=1 Tax=Plakobranchus ocellatus TaxID=259542 RepID=A0AAV3Z973_9GAST|nr:hypothetical protein PoB_001768600 [Plakobranchus ocellatus]
MSELTARLVKLGRDLGLEGPELRAFVKEERDREEKREAQERQEKKEAQERQEKREAQEREDKMRKEEQERKDKLELEKLKLQAEIENAKSLYSKKDSSTTEYRKLYFFMTLLFDLVFSGYTPRTTRAIRPLTHIFSRSVQEVGI